ncbi:MAG: NAD(P)H-dependent oxidoreductase [Oscillospiraceae bacterium]|nr:NAD(P)H-dependent oxidoreductase [Oscillospiraceae bacterium]
MILFIDACARENSRTRQLAEHLLGRLGGDAEHIRLYDVTFPVCDENFVNKRTTLSTKGDFSDAMFDLAKQFATADKIVIAAPFWDLSFPSVLKQYIEQICVTGLTFFYDENGIPRGLCKADKLWYVTTAGGTYFPEDYGFGYIKAVAQGFFGIGRTELIKAVGLDIYGADTEKIMNDAFSAIDTADLAESR